MGLTATYVDADTFTVAGDYAADFVADRKVRCNCGVDGYKYGVVLNSSYGAPNTTVNLTADSDDLTANLTAVDWSVVKPGTAGNIPLHDHSDEDKGGGNLKPSATIFIGDTANANMTLGLTINQGAAKDEIFAAKSSDVDHGMTALAETDSYGDLKRAWPLWGGLMVEGLSKTTNSLLFQADNTADDTAKSTAAYGGIVLRSALKSGTGVNVHGADANLVVIQNYGTARFIFDAEGSAHADVEWTTYDEQDDVALLDALEAEFDTRKAVTQEFGKVIGENKALLQEAGVVNFYDDGPRAMVNWTRLNMLMVGALRQLGAKVEKYERVLLSLGVSPKLLEVG